ncbi:MAG: hypothetical protein KDE51_19455 [Anaerolineales bacterium]|nr:hypothetical protein [Anaerolineales bacterium]
MTIRNNKQTPLTETARQKACIEQALVRYEQARADGLCHDGALEVAMSGLTAQDSMALITALEQEKK